MFVFNKSLFWFRRDLRITDNAALYYALKCSYQVFCVFIYDRAILDTLSGTHLSSDRRVDFIYSSINELDRALHALGSNLIIRHAEAVQEIPQVAMRLDINAVFCNDDYEPAALVRDASIRHKLKAQGCSWFSFKDQVIFDKEEILTKARTPFVVFTAYKKAWLNKLNSSTDKYYYVKAYPVESYLASLAPVKLLKINNSKPLLQELGFQLSNLHTLGILTGMSGAKKLFKDFLVRLDMYANTRDFPFMNNSSGLSVHLRFGTISIRALVRAILNIINLQKENHSACVWLSELIWRDFYFMIAYHYPDRIIRAFKLNYNLIIWENDDAAKINFKAWCEGRTGYPLVDAAMLHLNQTGCMHNRLRMITASFLIKDLGLNWRWGENYFSKKLNDFDLAINNGNWQWAASSGCDAVPYFRIFNPIKQSQKFDPEGKFIRCYLPQLSKLSNEQIHAPWLCSDVELASANIELNITYPKPIVYHEIARKKTLLRYSIVNNKNIC